ncbi:MAG: bacterial/archaeal transporter family-2 protein [Frankiaceae bacterium]|nr:bacterial/archaeal transporter family-2 protein [Frankiaceae bacterium]
MGDRLTHLLVLAVVAAGGLLGLQARINGELGARLHSAVDAALLSFGVGTTLLLVVVAIGHRDGVRRLRATTVRWWWWLGGLAGAALVASTAEGVPQVGVALVSVCIVAGTAVGALVVDGAGLGPGGRRAVDGLRLGGAVLAVGAVALGAVGDDGSAVRPALLLVLFASGAASALQQAANGQLRRVSASASVAALASFLGGTLALVVIAGARGDLAGRSLPGEWWLYLGGLLGAIYIALAAASVQPLGVLRLSLATVAGQLLGGVILDLVWPAPGIELKVTTVIGAALTLVAVGVVGARRTSVQP